MPSAAAPCQEAGHALLASSDGHRCGALRAHPYSTASPAAVSSAASSMRSSCSSRRPADATSTCTCTPPLHTGTMRLLLLRDSLTLSCMAGEHFLWYGRTSVTALQGLCACLGVRLADAAARVGGALQQLRLQDGEHALHADADAHRRHRRAAEHAHQAVVPAAARTSCGTHRATGDSSASFPDTAGASCAGHCCTCSVDICRVEKTRTTY